MSFPPIDRKKRSVFSAAVVSFFSITLSMPSQKNPGQVGLGSSRPESTRPGQLGRVKSALYIRYSCVRIG